MRVYERKGYARLRIPNKRGRLRLYLVGTTLIVTESKSQHAALCLPSCSMLRAQAQGSCSGQRRHKPARLTPRLAL